MPRNESSRCAGKRPMRAMTPQEKMDAIGRVHTGESKAAVARDIGVPESTLRGWCKAEEKIRTQLNNVRATGTYEQILTSSSDNSDNSRAGSSSRSTPTQNTMGMPSGSAERVEEPEAGPAPKRMKTENNLTPAAAVIAAAAAAAAAMPNIGITNRSTMMGDTIFNPYLYNLLLDSSNKTLAAFNSFVKADAMSSLASLPYSTTPNLTENLQIHRNNGAMINMTNLLPANNVPINGKKKYTNMSGYVPTTEPLSTRVSARRQNILMNRDIERSAMNMPSTSGNQTSPTPSTSTSFASTSNSDVAASASSRASRDGKKLNLDAIICQLQQQQQNAVLAERVCNIGEMISNNPINTNNNNAEHVDNETTNRRFPSSLPPGFSDMLTYCSKLIEWLQVYGSPVCTFQQVVQIRAILDGLLNWANSKSNQLKKKPNGTS